MSSSTLRLGCLRMICCGRLLFFQVRGCPCVCAHVCGVSSRISSSPMSNQCSCHFLRSRSDTEYELLLTSTWAHLQVSLKPNWPVNTANYAQLRTNRRDITKARPEGVQWLNLPQNWAVKESTRNLMGCLVMDHRNKNAMNEAKSVRISLFLST